MCGNNLHGPLPSCIGNPSKGCTQHFVAAYNLLDATFMIFVNAIKGAGDTQFVLRVSLVLALLLTVFSYLSVEVWHLGVYGCWMLITIWVWVAALTFYLRFRGGKWRTMRVIEGKNQDLAPIQSDLLPAVSAE